MVRVDRDKAKINLPSKANHTYAPGPAELFSAQKTQLSKKYSSNSTRGIKLAVSNVFLIH